MINYQILSDNRVSIVHKIVDALISEVESRSCIIMITDYNELIINNMDMILYRIPLKEVSESLPGIVYCYAPLNINGNPILLDDYSYIPASAEIALKMNNLYNDYITKTQYMKPVAQENSLRNNNTFEKLLSIKASNGVRFFRMLGLDMSTYYMVPVISGFPKLNKPDTLGLTIYREGGNQIIKMNIFKKKINREFQMYYRALVV